MGIVCKVEESLKMGTIYIATNLTNQKQYVGRTVQNFKNRKNSHIKLSKEENPKFFFHKAIKKYGVDSFKWICIEYPKKELNEMEMFWIKTLGTKAPNGYNLTDGGEGTFNPSKITRMKMSEKRKGMYEGEKNPFFGKHHSTEVCQFLSDINKGENHPHWGKKHSEKTKQLQSLNIKNHPQRKEINEKIRKAKLKMFKFLSPKGKEVIWKNGINKFCEYYQLNYHSICAIMSNHWKRTEYKGWKFLGMVE
jgi:group I intron endonuclease